MVEKPKTYFTVERLDQMNQAQGLEDSQEPVAEQPQAVSAAA